MIATIHPSSIHGLVTAAASKSAMQRACALALLHRGETIIQNPGRSNDDLAALDIIRKLGAETEIKDEALRIKNDGECRFAGTIHCGESGLGIRMFTPIAALSGSEVIIEGSGSLRNRPMHFFDEILPQLGVQVESNKGYLPIKIKGPLRPADCTIDGSLSSQFLTGLLMAFSKAAKEPVVITVTNLKSKPYIDLTLKMMNDFGYAVVNERYERFLIGPSLDFARDLSRGPSTSLRTIIVEGDWSGAAFLLVAGAIAGSATVQGLDTDSAQADKALLNALKDCGARVSVTNDGITVAAPAANALTAFRFDATDCPDLFPPLVALAAYCKGVSVIKGVERLRHKESDRSASLQQEFEKMGVTITVDDDEMRVTGGNGLTGARVHSHHDHRIAMAAAVAALKANGETVIEEADAINKSYPDFYRHLKMLGASVSLP